MKNDGFTLPELLISVVILAIVLVGMLALFINASVLGELAGNKTAVMIESQNKMEEVRNYDFSLITTDYASGGTPGNIFDLAIATGKGRIYIDDTNPDLLEIKVVISYQNKMERIIGEDTDLDGEMDGGEDVDGDGELSSDATLTTLVTER